MLQPLLEFRQTHNNNSPRPQELYGIAYLKISQLGCNRLLWIRLLLLFDRSYPTDKQLSVEMYSGFAPTFGLQSLSISSSNPQTSSTDSEPGTSDYSSHPWRFSERDPAIPLPLRRPPRSLGGIFGNAYSVCPANEEKPSPFAKIPAEVRVKIWKQLFSVPYDLSLIVNDDGSAAIDHFFRFPLQLLRLCKAVYTEAFPELYGFNLFAIQMDNVHNLHKFDQVARGFIKQVVVSIPDGKYDSRLHLVDLGAIGVALPNLDSFRIHASSASQLLVNAHSFATDICNIPSLRRWPIFRIIAKVPMSKYYRNADPADVRRVDPDHYNRLTRDDDSFSLTSFPFEPQLRNGRQMPDYGEIRLCGSMAERWCELIRDYKCSFGDCFFSKRVVRSFQKLPDWAEEGREYPRLAERLQDPDNPRLPKKVDWEEHEYTWTNDPDYLGKVTDGFVAHEACCADCVGNIEMTWEEIQERFPDPTDGRF